MTALEDKIIAEFKDGKASVERTLLAISGLETEEEIFSYQRKLDFIQEDFEKSCPKRAGDYQTAELLFDYLWRTKPNRYNGDFLLTEVIDNQFDENKKKGVGDCVGLTSLYTVLGQRLGLNLSVLLSTNHILNLLFCNQEIVVENNNIRGFDSEFESGYKKTDLIGLVASVINNKGHVKQRLGDLKCALRDYNRAIELEPDFASAFNNRGVVKDNSGDYEGALRDYNRAIELEPDFASAFNNRGVVKEDSGDYEGALRDYNRAIELKPDYANAFNNRGIVKDNSGDYEGALRDYNRAIELKPDFATAFNNRELLLRQMQGLPR